VRKKKKAAGRPTIKENKERLFCIGKEWRFTKKGKTILSSTGCSPPWGGERGHPVHPKKKKTPEAK